MNLISIELARQLADDRTDRLRRNASRRRAAHRAADQTPPVHPRPAA